MSLREGSYFLALITKMHAGSTETHTAETQPSCALASLEVPLLLLADGKIRIKNTVQSYNPL